MICYAFDPKQDKAKQVYKTEANKQQVNNKNNGMDRSCFDELTYSKTSLRFKQCRSRLSPSLRRGSAASCLLGLRVRIPPGA